MSEEETSETHPKPDVVKCLEDLLYLAKNPSKDLQYETIMNEDDIFFEMAQSGCTVYDKDSNLILNPRLSEPTDAELIVLGIKLYSESDTGILIQCNDCNLWYNTGGDGDQDYYSWNVGDPIPPEARAYLLSAYKEAHS